METGGGGSRKVSLQKADSNRTLLDVIRDDPTSGGGHGKDGKRSWRHFKEKLRLHRNGSGRGSAWTSTMHTPTSDVPINHRQNTNAASNNNRMMARRASARYSSAGEATQPDISAVPDVDMELMSNRGNRAPRLERNISRAMERNMSRAIERNMSRASGRFEHTNSLAMRRSRGLEEHDDDFDSDETPKSVEHEEGESKNGDEEEEKDGGWEKKPVRMSLMALLAETEGLTLINSNYELHQPRVAFGLDSTQTRGNKGT
ncbi:uncharacterized protein Fot_41487 [Forsythia ovata]|uniref:Uncharacterized protein n=1 Tax=Forsythia ovata TaxID=205694 RepID=A0ABD1RIH6_9LAMI